VPPGPLGQVALDLQVSVTVGVIHPEPVPEINPWPFASDGGCMAR
jgi:hypothetical protein